jgi:hypothetical protein
MTPGTIRLLLAQLYGQSNENAISLVVLQEAMLFSEMGSLARPPACSLAHSSIAARTNSLI